MGTFSGHPWGHSLATTGDFHTAMDTAQLRAQGWSNTRLGERYGVSRQTVTGLAQGSGCFGVRIDVGSTVDKVLHTAGLGWAFLVAEGHLAQQVHEGAEVDLRADDAVDPHQLTVARSALLDGLDDSLGVAQGPARCRRVDLGKCPASLAWQCRACSGDRVTMLVEELGDGEVLGRLEEVVQLPLLQGGQPAEWCRVGFLQ